MGTASKLKALGVNCPEVGLAYPYYRKGDRCDTESQGLFCTRPVNHPGAHHAHCLKGSDNLEVLGLRHCLRIWPPEFAANGACIRCGGRGWTAVEAEGAIIICRQCIGTGKVK